MSSGSDGSSSSTSEGTSEETISAYFIFFTTLLAVVLILSKLLHDRQWLASILPEAGMIIMVGIIAGSLVHWTYGDERIGRSRGMDSESERYFTNTYYGDDDGNNGNVDYQVLVENVLSFSPNVFFVALLPPIIFNSGYHLRRELFFRHIAPIALLAVVGTLVSALVIAFFLKFVTFMGWTTFMPTMTELLAFGALISATDPVSTLAVFQAKRVDPQLFYLVFGESVLNDAVGLILFETFCKFVQRDNGAGKIAMGVCEFIGGFVLDSVASPLLGWICAIGSALMFKYIDFRNNKLLELSIYLLIMYVPFFIAEVLKLSGIVTILATGVAARHYVEPNLTEQTQETADLIFRLAAHLAETSIFLELGLSVIGVTEFLQWPFIMWSLLACLIARACHVYPITEFFNQSLQRGTVGYNLREQAKEIKDGIMKSDFVESTLLPKWTQHQEALKARENSLPRKPLSGNLELSEHLNDFSSRHPMAEEDHLQLSEQQHQDSIPPPPSESVQPPPNDQEAPPIPMVRTGSDVRSVASLTPIPKRDMKIQPNTAHMLWFSGLRGAVAYACVRSFPDTFGHQKEFMSTTMMIVLATVFFMGGATETVLRWLDIEMNVNEEQFMEDWIKSDQAPKSGVFSYLGKCQHWKRKCERS